MSIDLLSLYGHEERSWFHLPGIVGQPGNSHALVPDPFQHFEAPLDRADQFIECHVTIYKPAMANFTGSSTATPR